ncbi:MAG TPA: S1 family peptidase [Polyangiaceae bacterium]|nr:S1 family peptidase [Polyangiaceae bacterium]
MITNKIYFGSGRSSLVGLTDARRAAIVIVHPGGDDALCTGVMIGPAEVLTAAHCTTESETLSVSSGDGSFAVAEVLRHPKLDAALLRVPDLATTEATPILPDPGLDDLGTGSLLELAGYGLDESGSVGTLRFAVEAVQSVALETFVVDGEGRSGACVGDSGGPALRRGADGHVRLAGILDAGSSDCVGRDAYVRADALATWLRSSGYSPGQDPEGCDDVSASGECWGTLAMHCEQERIVVSSCASPNGCTWSDSVGRYDCVQPEESSCLGFDSLGACVDGAAVICEAGHLTRLDCKTCGTSCNRAVDGVAACFEL